MQVTRAGVKEMAPQDPRDVPGELSRIAPYPAGC